MIPLYVLIACLIIALLVFLTIELRYGSREKELANTPPEVSSEYYYYNQLTCKEQLLFKSIKKAAEAYIESSEILPYRYNENEFIRVSKAITFDCPELFYLDLNSLQMFCDSYKTSVSMKYYDTPDNVKNMKMELEAVCAAAKARTQNSKNEFEKAVVLHDYLTTTCSYFNQNSLQKPENVHTSYGALVSKKASCDGYASAYKMLLNRCGIECITVEGTIDGVPHLWNIAKQDGKYYHIDCTWNDADTDSLSKLSFHGFFNLSDRVVTQSRKMSKTFIIPTCTDESNYYSSINARAESLEKLEDVAYSQLSAAIKNEKNFFEFLPDFTSSEEDFKDRLLAAIDRINGEYEKPVLSRSYRLYDTASGSYAYTVQIYYINQ